MKLRNAWVGATVGTSEFFPLAAEGLKYHMVYGQILEVLTNGVVVRWDDIGDVEHCESDLRSMFIARKY